MKQPGLFSGIVAMLQDPPPDFAFEVAPDRVSIARVAGGAETWGEDLAPGVLEPSPIQENVLDPGPFADAIKRVTARLEPSRKTRRAALILPDHSARVSVLDFDTFPEKEEDRLPLLQFRLKKTLPYDVASARLSFHAQALGKGTKREVVAVVTPQSVIASYEAAFRAANFHPGIVTTSSLAMLGLVNPTGVSIVAKLSGGVLTVMAVDGETLRLVRSLELSALSLDEIASDLYPTFAYAEDNFGSRPDRLILCGFGDFTDDAARRFEEEMATRVECLRYRTPGLVGYLQSRGIQTVAA